MGIRPTESASNMRASDSSPDRGQRTKRPNTEEWRADDGEISRTVPNLSTIRTIRACSGFSAIPQRTKSYSGTPPGDSSSVTKGMACSLGRRRQWLTKGWKTRQGQTTSTGKHGCPETKKCFAWCSGEWIRGRASIRSTHFRSAASRDSVAESKESKIPLQAMTSASSGVSQTENIGEEDSSGMKRFSKPPTILLEWRRLCL